MLICFAIVLGIVKGEETNHILESKGVEKKMKERERARNKRKKVVSFTSWKIMLKARPERIGMPRQF
jgi:hypothetical protein